MIRSYGHTEDGHRMVFLVLEPDSVRRMLADNPIRLDLQRLVPGLTEPLILVLAATATDAEFQLVGQKMTQRAQETGATVHVIPRGSDDPQ